jgi:hypothetical protein
MQCRLTANLEWLTLEADVAYMEHIHLHLPVESDTIAGSSFEKQNDCER